MRQIAGLWMASFSLVLAACASSPPKPMTQAQFQAKYGRPMTNAESLTASQAYRRELKARALRSGIMAGEDPYILSEKLELMDCLTDTRWIEDPAQRPAAIQQCRVTWPQPVQQVQVQQTTNTNCYTQNGYTQCTSR